MRSQESNPAFGHFKDRISPIATNRYYCRAQPHLTIANGLFGLVRAGKTNLFRVPMRNVLIGYGLDREMLRILDDRVCKGKKRDFVLSG
jgi:hypothetical protein